MNVIVEITTDLGDSIDSIESLYSSDTIQQVTLITTNELYEIIDIADIIIDDDAENTLQNIQTIQSIFENSPRIICYNLKEKMGAFKRVIDYYKLDIKYNHADILCILDYTRDIVKKVNRYGVVDPTMNDITIKLFNENFIDIRDSRYSALTINRICKQLHTDYKLKTFSKQTLFSSFAKSFKNIKINI